MGDGGKGSAPRPLGIDWDKFEENWDAIFGEVGARGGADSNGDATSADVGDRPRKEAGDKTSPEHKPSK